MTLTFCFSGCGKNKDLSLLYDDETAYTATFTHFAAFASVSVVTSKKIELSFGKISGIKQITTLSIDENTTLDLDVDVTEGRLKIILVSGNDWYLVSEASVKDQNFKPSVPAGKYKLRIVADKAAAKIIINIKE